MFTKDSVGPYLCFVFFFVFFFFICEWYDYAGVIYSLLLRLTLLLIKQMCCRLSRRPNTIYSYCLPYTNTDMHVESYYRNVQQSISLFWFTAARTMGCSGLKATSIIATCLNQLSRKCLVLQWLHHVLSCQGITSCGMHQMIMTHWSVLYLSWSIPDRLADTYM